MTADETQAVSQIVLAFEDAATWYEELAAAVGERADAPEITTRMKTVLNQLKAHREQVARMRGHLGL